MTALRVLSIYEAAGAAWVAYNLTLLSTEGLGARMRDRLVEMWREGRWQRVGMVVSAALWLQFWPFAVVFTLMPHSWTPRLSSLFARYIRREYIDRPGLLQPQMPAARCPMHDVAFDMVRRPCGHCARVFDIGHCKACCTGCPVESDYWLCPECRFALQATWIGVDR